MILPLRPQTELDLFLFNNDLMQPGFGPAKPYVVSGRAAKKQTYEEVRFYIWGLVTFNLLFAFLNLTHCIILEGLPQANSCPGQ